MRRVLCWAVTGALLLAGAAGARELPRYYQGIRPLGMGGAFTAVADDENALFYNPAGLDRVERWRMGLVNPYLEVGENGYAFYKDARGTDFDSTTEVTELLRDYIGEYLHGRAGVAPYFVMPNFGVAAVGQAVVNTEPHNVAYPEVDVDATVTLGGHVGVGWGFIEDALRVGATLKYVRQSHLRQTYDAEDIASDDFEDQIRDDLKDGSGFGFDLGAMYTAPVLLEPTVAVVVQNVADLDMGDAGELAQQINLGMSFRHAFSWITVVGAADWVDVTNEIGLDSDPFKRLHFGLEGRLARILSGRVGLYQGYPTFGATVDFRLVRLDYATYAEEIGSSAGTDPDRRHAIQLTFGW